MKKKVMSAVLAAAMVVGLFLLAGETSSYYNLLLTTNMSDFLRKEIFYVPYVGQNF